MRTALLFSILILWIFILGCSGKNSLPTSPAQDNNLPGQSVGEGSSEVIMSGTMDIEKGTVEFNNRMADPYYNVTGLLGSNFTYRINGTIPPDVFDLTLTINNVSMITVYDVCIVFENLYGKTVTNADVSMDIWGLFDMDPFIPFRKTDPVRAFPHGSDSIQCLLKYPAGANPRIDFFIIAHLPGNTGGVYDFADWNVEGELTAVGGQAHLSIRVIDWQNDISLVWADTREINDVITTLTRRGYDTWEANINVVPYAPSGNRYITVMATSPSSPAYNTYKKCPVLIKLGGTVFGNEIDIDGDTFYDFVSTFSSDQHSIAARGDNFYLIYWGLGDSWQGATFFTKSTDGGATWSTAKAITPIGDGNDERDSCLALGEENIYVAYQLAPTDDIYVTMSFNDGNTWNHHLVTGGLDGQTGFPTLCVDSTGAKEIVYVGMTCWRVATGTRIFVARASTDNLESWKYTCVSDKYDTENYMFYPSIAFDPEFDHIMICWTDQNTVSVGARVMFDAIRSSDYDLPFWNADIPVSDNWDNNWEEEPSISLKPNSSLVGITYKSNFSSSDDELRIVQIDQEDLQDLRVSPSVLIHASNEISSTSLVSEQYGHWLVAFTLQADDGDWVTMFDQSYDDGKTWMSFPSNISPDFDGDCKNPTIATNGEDVCVAWRDDRNGYLEIWVDHGVQD